MPERLVVFAIAGQRAHIEGMDKRATKRPQGFVKPAHWTDDPAPAPARPDESDEPDELSPTRYGDWVSRASR